MSPLLKGYTWAITSTILMAIALVLTKASSIFNPEVDFLNLIFWGWGTSMFAVSIFWAPQKKIRTRIKNTIFLHHKLVLKLTGLGILNSLLWFYALSTMEGGIVSLLDLSFIFWSFLLGIIFLGERFHKREIPGIFLAIIGIIVIAQIKNGAPLLGVIALLIVNLLMAIQSLLIRKYKKPLNAMPLAFVRAWGMWMSFAIPMFIFGLIQFDLSWSFLGLVFIGQLFGVFFARGAAMAASIYLPISRFSLVSLLGPVLVLLFSWMWLQEPLSTQKITGALLIITGLSWLVITASKSKK